MGRVRGDGQAHGQLHSPGMSSLASPPAMGTHGVSPSPYPYPEGCIVQGLQRQPAAIAMEARLQALGTRMLSATNQTPVLARDPLLPLGTFRAQNSLWQCWTEGICGPSAAESTDRVWCHRRVRRLQGEGGCEQEPGAGLGGCSSAEGLCKAPEGSASSCQPRSGMAPSPMELRGCSCPRDGDAGGLSHSASLVTF